MQWKTYFSFWFLSCRLNIKYKYLIIFKRYYSRYTLSIRDAKNLYLTVWIPHTAHYSSLFKLIRWMILTLPCVYQTHQMLWCESYHLPMTFCSQTEQNFVIDFRDQRFYRKVLTLKFHTFNYIHSYICMLVFQLSTIFDFANSCYQYQFAP